MLTTVSITQARSKLLEIVRETEITREPFVITKGGKAKAVLMNANEFEEWIATLEIVTDSKALKSLRQGLRDLKTRKTKSFEEVFGKPFSRTRAKR